MSRNFNSRFDRIPQVDIQRSGIRIDSGTLTTCNAGELVPFRCFEVLPGASYYLEDAKFVARMTPSVHATMDNAFIDFYYFFVPNRIVWDDWKHFFGEPENYWIPSREYVVPQIQFPNGGFSSLSVADHFGLPTLVDARNSTDDSNTVNALPILGFCHIWNNYFRDENLQAPLYCPTDTNTIQNIVGWQIGSQQEQDAPLSAVMHGASLPKVCKPHDYFTSALPSPLRSSSPVTLPLGGTIPVVPSGTFNQNLGSLTGQPLYWMKKDGSATSTGTYDLMFYNTNGVVGTVGTSASAGTSPTQLVPSNLVGYLDQSTVTGINELRYAFALQHFYEHMARGGARYVEILHNIFGVSDPNPAKDIPQYLGGDRINISMNSVVQTSSTVNSGSTQGSLGSTAGYSHTAARAGRWSFAAQESGYIIGCFCIRNGAKTYQQGVNRMWRRKNLFDFYFPEFANVGEMPIRADEIYFASESDDSNSKPFGYQEAWASYRYCPYTLSGMFRSNYLNGNGANTSLDSWHYADYYESRPYLSDTWIEDNSRQNIDRTLVVQSSVENQFLLDISWNEVHVLPMPVYSIPGLEKL